MRLYLIALQFLTIIPLPFRVRCEENDLGRSMAFFPLVGLTLGALLVGSDYLLALCLPPRIVDLLLIVILSVVTGALHLDGLADVCDGLAARGSRERFLAVMKDSSIGAVGAVGLILDLLLKYQLLSVLPEEIRREALLCFPLVARYSQVQLTVRARRARQDGLGSVFIGGAGNSQLIIAAATAILLSVLLLGAPGLVVSGGACLCTWGMKVWSHWRLGGITGDVIGCVSEMNELLCLLLIVAWAGTGRYL